MAETPNETMQEAAELAAVARERGIEHLEGAKAQLAEGAERVASAVERTADQIEGDGDDAISGFGRSVASLMRQLAGGLRERDVEAFAQELGALARRNPGVFLAGSVALGFGIARFFKARGPQSRSSYDFGRQSAGAWQSAEESGRGWEDDLYSEEALNLSARSTDQESGSEPTRAEEEKERTSQSHSALRGSSAAQPSAPRDQERDQAKSRDAAKQKAKPQRSSSGVGSTTPSNEPPSTDPSPSGGTPGSGGSAFTGGKGSGALRGGKS